MRADPDSAITRSQHGVNGTRHERLAALRLPWNGAHAVEAHQSVRSRKPQVPVSGLGDGDDPCVHEPLASRPGAVGVLADVERLSECRRLRAQQRHYQRRDGPHVMFADSLRDPQVSRECEGWDANRWSA